MYVHYSQPPTHQRSHVNIHQHSYIGIAYSGKISRAKIFEVDLPQNSSRIKFRGSTRLSLHLYAIIRFSRINFLR